MGPNGVGKTSFLNLIAGKLGVTEGEIKRGETCVLGYYEQQVSGPLSPNFISMRLRFDHPAFVAGACISTSLPKTDLGLTLHTEGLWRRVWTFLPT